MFRVGSKVVCINNSRIPKKLRPKLFETYKVVSINKFGGLIFEEFPLPSLEFENQARGFKADRFVSLRTYNTDKDKFYKRKE